MTRVSPHPKPPTLRPHQDAHITQPDHTVMRAGSTTKHQEPTAKTTDLSNPSGSGKDSRTTAPPTEGFNGGTNRDDSTTSRHSLSLKDGTVTVTGQGEVYLLNHPWIISSLSPELCNV